MGIAYFFKRQFDEAAAKLLLAIQDDPGFPPPYRSLAACYAHMGRLDEAREIVARLRAITPLVVPTDLPFATPRTASSPVGPAPGGGRGDMSQTRRLAAILAADVAGYSRLMGADEEGTLERLKALRRELVDPKIAEHQRPHPRSSRGPRRPVTACRWNFGCCGSYACAATNGTAAFSMTPGEIICRYNLGDGDAHH